MKFGYENDSLIFYPEEDMDFFAFGKMVGRHELNYTINCHTTEGKIERFEIKGKDIWSELVDSSYNPDSSQENP